MIQITHTYPNHHMRTFTITAVIYDEDGENLGVMTTVEDGAIAINPSDTPDIWTQIQETVFAKEET